jgi:hypothetical protein
LVFGICQESKPTILLCQRLDRILKDAKNMPEPEPVDGSDDDEHECIEE